MSNKNPDKKLSPSQFMRKLRPEYYSDTEDRTLYVLDGPTLEYHLETLTQRNQTHDFEIFCRKLCERTICPSLRPQTGPEGGGDSKADTETYPVADEIADLTYVGQPNIGNQRWAFAFSAKERWSQKVRSDVEGLVKTGRSYDRIFFVTSRFARAKDRARIEDDLTNEFGIPVTIHDRSWIVTEIIEKDRKDIAFNYLGIGEHAWNVARWKGVAYAELGPQLPPAMILLFQDEYAAVKIFERWRERLGDRDENDEIQLTVIRQLPATNPNHYIVVVASRVPDLSDSGERQGLAIATRSMTMTPNDSANFDRFLTGYHRSGSYVLAPGVWRPGQSPDLMLELGLIKKVLNLKLAAHVGEEDVEAIALRMREP